MPGSIAIIDYEMGNLFNVHRACEYVGLKPVITSDISVIMNSNAIILPGVGAFGDAMSNLIRLDLVSPLRDFIEKGKQFMGICLGMQLLMSESEEFGYHKGLDIIKGTVVKLPFIERGDRRVKVPQVGWNRISQPFSVSDGFWGDSPLQGIRNNEFMYFVHSLYAEPEEKEVILSYTDYEGIEFSSCFFKKNVFACQFHPEKSANEGLKIYRNWACMIEKQIRSGCNE